MPRQDIVVLGASSGGIPALQALLSCLPRRLPVAVFIVLHRASGLQGSEDMLPAVLMHRTNICVEAAEDGRAFEIGGVYVAPRNLHLVLERGTMHLEGSPRESRARARPSIDVLFRSAALAYGTRVVGVVLTGLLDDGVAGLWQIRKRGGVTIVQDPDEAMYPSMPNSALEHVSIDYRLPLEGIATKLMELARGSMDPAEMPARLLLAEDEF